MSRYIPFAQMKQLREAAKNGDDRAKKIIAAQLDDECDFSHDLEEYFNPKPITTMKEEAVVEEKIPHVEEETEEEETPKEKEEQLDVKHAILSVVSACDDKIIEVINDDDLSDATKRGVLDTLAEIKQSCLENMQKFAKLLKSVSKKDTQNQEQLI